MKLTRAQQQLLSEVALGDDKCSDAYSPAVRLVELGLYIWAHEGRLAITEAGRARAADTIDAKDTALAEMRKAVSATLTWAVQRCPCRNEEPNPCPLCGASVENLEACKSAENTMPRHILEMLRAARALGPLLDEAKL